MDDINPIDVTVAKLSEINKSLSYFWLGDIHLMRRLRMLHYFGVIDHVIQVTVMVK